MISNDFAVLRRFRGDSSLSTYLTVVARRVIVRELLKRKTTARLSEAAGEHHDLPDAATPAPEERISNREELERLMGGLSGSEADVVRMYHLEGKSYREISSAVGLPENSIGPTLSRARTKMRHATGDS